LAIVGLLENDFSDTVISNVLGVSLGVVRRVKKKVQLGQEIVHGSLLQYWRSQGEPVPLHKFYQLMRKREIKE
jgi:hypothetical protein